MSCNEMGKCTLTYTEMRFVIEDELTQVYVAIRADGDCPLGAQGWHHKTFPASMNPLQILKKWEDGAEEPMLWSQQAPR